MLWHRQRVTESQAPTEPVASRTFTNLQLAPLIARDNQGGALLGLTPHRADVLRPCCIPHMARPLALCGVALLASLLCFTVELYPSRPKPAGAQPARLHPDAACEPLRERASVASKAGNLAEAPRPGQAGPWAAPDPRLIFNIARLQQRLTRPRKPSAPISSSSAPLHWRTPTSRRVLLLPAQQYARLQGASRSPDSGSRAAAQKSSTLVYKTWWFWTVVGVAAAGVATASDSASPRESQTPQV